MKKFLFITVLLSVFSFLLSPMAAKTNKQTVVLSCNLHCQGCCDKVMKNIAFERGVKDLVCDLKHKTVTVTYDANKTDIPTLLVAFEKIGKPAVVQEQPGAASASGASSAAAETPKHAVAESTDSTDASTGASTPY
ncbi:MAG: cation transporter [Paludibacteraceae bacterium]|nr:cation transporter [Paludibacteraceae bacterium]